MYQLRLGGLLPPANHGMRTDAFDERTRESVATQPASAAVVTRVALAAASGIRSILEQSLADEIVDNRRDL